jgi:hypothetical protein
MAVLCTSAVRDAKNSEVDHGRSGDFLTTRNAAPSFHYRVLRELAVFVNAYATQIIAIPIKEDSASCSPVRNETALR